jgi:hypothetical protein
MATVRAGASSLAREARGTFVPLSWALLALGFLLLAPPVSADTGTLVRQGGRRVVVVTGGEVRPDLALPDELIVVATDSVSVDGAVLARGIDYRIDYDRSSLVIVRELPDTAAVRVTYRYLPLGLLPIYRHAVIESVAAGPGDSERVATLEQASSEAERRPPLGAGLSVGGAKTFGITAGSDRDVTLEQSLRLNVSGNITRDVTVNGYLSDQNIPLVPEGDTEELRALDKVLLEIEGPGVSATMGDYELRVEGGTLASVRRELSGAMGTATIGSARLLLAGARSAGEFMSATFRGTDGKQGPYLLSDRSGGTDISVVPGSERVWLGGERLTRGTDLDYVIDYQVGEITFMERRPILSETEITVDYEYTLSDYERSTYAGRATASLAGGSVDLGGSFFREVDDRGASSVALTDEDVAILRAAGDDVALAFDDGVDSVGSSQGDYARVGHGVFEYAGPDSGDFDLSFERTQGGDYSYNYVHGFYTYVGAGEGEYRLGKRLPLPADHTLVALDGRIAFPRQGYVAAETALSDLDKNTFSELDDGDNLGNAEVLSAGLPEASFGALGGGTVGLSLTARRVGGNFRGIGRYRDVRYDEKWELAGLALPEEELLVEGTSNLRLDGGGRFSLTQAYLARGDALDSRKSEFSFEAHPTARSRLWADGRLVTLSYAPDSTLVGENRERTLYRGGVEHVFGSLRPGIFYGHDARATDEAGERYDEYGASLESVGAGRLSFGARYAFRRTDRSQGDGWARASRTTTEEYRATVTGPGSLTLDGNVVRRATEFEEGFAEPGSRYDLVSVRATESLLSDALTGEARYTVTSTEIEEKERYVTHEGDVEIVHIVSTGRYLPVTELSTSTRWALKFRSRTLARAGLPEPSAWGRFLSALSFDTDVRLTEMTTTNDKRRLYLLDPSVIQGEDTVRGEIVGRHTARYLAPGGSVSARLAFTTRDGLDRSYTNSSQETMERAATADVKISRGGSTTVRLQGDLGRRAEDAVGGDTYRIDERALLAEVSAEAVRNLEAKLTGRVAFEDEAVEGIDATRVEVAPSFTYRFRGVGTASASVTRTLVQTSADELPTYLAEGRAPGVTLEWRIMGEYRFNRYLTGSVNYTAAERPTSDPRQTLDVRVNAFF